MKLDVNEIIFVPRGREKKTNGEYNSGENYDERQVSYLIVAFR